MRPTRLELTGFGSFREPTTIDFVDTDLFVLAGPTGAGKSTVIDAVIFALYGSVPRYDDRRLVAPVINQGRVEAKVRLDFVVDGRGYTAARIVRRTKTGATTKEARLEQWNPDDTDEQTTALAGNEKELTEGVERLLGLSFDHFTRCVVLPQGAFAQFLHARAAERQDLLVELLGIEVYRRIGRRARERARQAQMRVEHTRRRLDSELADATPEALAAAGTRVETLASLQTTIVEAQPELEGLRERGVELRATAERARERAGLLDGMAQPAGVGALAQRLHDAGRAEADAIAAAEKAEQQRQAAEEARRRLPDGAVIAELQRLLAERAAREASIGPAAAARKEAAATAEALATEATRAEQAVAAVRAQRERVREANMAAVLAAGLQPGDACPVCAQTVDHPAEHVESGDLDAATAACARAEREAARMAADHQRASAEAARMQQAHDTAVAAHRETAARVEDLARQHDIALGDVSRLVDAVAQADRALAALRSDEQAARTAVRHATAAVRDLDGQRRDAWATFDAARDRLGVLEPPPAQRDDLAAAWAQLLAWADEQRPLLAAAADQASEAVEAVAGRWRARTRGLVEACQAAGVTVDGGDARSACAAALERARGRHARISHAIETAERLRAEIARDTRVAETATALGQHLGARRFEQWLLNQALAHLVADASVRLRQLSSQAYSLRVDDAGQFVVVDHRNADELRSARTLSGGETFLASLSLALSLADHVAQLAAGSSARLDALFLDEGFGTLDHDTLDVVAAALEELGAQGRTVGLVTHVRELAERMPVRFEVRRTGETSTVQRVET